MLGPGARPSESRRATQRTRAQKMKMPGLRKKAQNALIAKNAQKTQSHTHKKQLLLCLTAKSEIIILLWRVSILAAKKFNWFAPKSRIYLLEIANFIDINVFSFARYFELLHFCACIFLIILFLKYFTVIYNLGIIDCLNEEILGIFIHAVVLFKAE